MRNTVGIATWFLLLGACGDDGGSASLDDIPNRFASASCQRVDTCLGGFGEAFLGGDCVEQITRTIEDQNLPLWEAGVAAGTLVYDDNAASRCLDELRDIPCDAPDNETPSCDIVFTGTVEVGSNCSVDEECAGAAYCRTESSCPGTCRGRGEAGAACESDEECEDGLGCNGAVCAVVGGVGSLCTGDDDCGGFLSCRDNLCTSLSDIATASIGEPCDPDGGVLCREGSCVIESFDPMTETIVWQCVGTSSSGGPCNVGFPDACPNGQACDADLGMGMLEGTCQDLPGAGMACASGRCEAGLECVADTCRALQRLGASCSGDEECYSDSCSAGVCTSPACL